MTYFRLPNNYSATITEGVFPSLISENRYKVTVKNACGLVEEELFCSELSDCMDYLSEF